MNAQDPMSVDSFLANTPAGQLVAVTAPFESDDGYLVGLSNGKEKTCVQIQKDEFASACTSLYPGKHRPLAVHGLKGIWEYLDEVKVREDTERDKCIDTHNILDTKLMAFLLDPDSKGDGLALTHLHKRYLEHEYPHEILRIDDEPDEPVYYQILADDAHRIHCLATVLWDHMSPSLRRLYNSLELPLMLVLDRMRRTGIGVDGIGCEREVHRLGREMALAAQDITGGADVDLSSYDAVFDFLLRQGIRFDDTRLYRSRKFLQSAMEEIAYIQPVIQKVLDWWNMGQDLGFLRQATGQKRIHATWGQTRARTSRIYAREPALQNVSRGLRYLFVPAPGHVLIKADYSQAQMRILAHLSGDDNLVAIFNDATRDVHRETAGWLGVHDRDVGKEVNFAICFGMGASALASKLTGARQGHEPGKAVDMKTAQTYIDAFYARYPKVRQFFAREWAKLKKTPLEERVVRSLIGRERRFDRRANRAVERQFRATWPQQIEADMVKAAMVRLDTIFCRRKMGSKIVMMIHDALWVEAPQKEAEQARYLMKKMMTTAAKLKVPLEVDFSD
jgi:DNA polymerase-1